MKAVVAILSILTLTAGVLAVKYNGELTGLENKLAAERAGYDESFSKLKNSLKEKHELALAKLKEENLKNQESMAELLAKYGKLKAESDLKDKELAKLKADFENQKDEITKQTPLLAAASFASEGEEATAQDKPKARSYNDVMKELMNTKEMQERRKSRNDRRFNDKWGEFEPNVAPEVKEELMALIREKSDEISAQRSNMWMSRGGEENSYEDVKKTMMQQVSDMETEIKSRFGDQVYAEYKSHKLEEPTRRTLQRIPSLRSNDEKLDQLVDVYVGIKVRNEYDDDNMRLKLMTVNKEELAEYKQAKTQVVDEFVAESGQILNPEELQSLKDSLTKQQKDIDERLERMANGESRGWWGGRSSGRSSRGTN